MEIINIECNENAIKEANQARLNNRGKWLQLNISSGENLVQIKSFNTSIQVVQSWGKKIYRDGGHWDLSVKQWRANIAKYLETSLND
jgi:hypothetical protein